MFRHWRIRYNNRDEYVTTRDGKGSQLEQVVRHCIVCKYALAEVRVIETATVKINCPLMDFIIKAIH